MPDLRTLFDRGAPGGGGAIVLRQSDEIEDVGNSHITRCWHSRYQ